jgi:hypothetical protein
MNGSRVARDRYACSPKTNQLTKRTSARLQRGGVEVRLLHFGDEPANGETVVYFPALKVVAVGDLLTSEMPAANSISRQRAPAWDATLSEILKLDFDVVVPAKGPLATRHDLEVFKSRLDALVTQ